MPSRVVTRFGIKIMSPSSFGVPVVVLEQKISLKHDWFNNDLLHKWYVIYSHKCFCLSVISMKQRVIYLEKIITLRESNFSIV